MIISNESMNFKDPKESDDPQVFDDPQLFDDQLEVWTLIIEKSTVIPPSLMVLLKLIHEFLQVVAWICIVVAGIYCPLPNRA